jgi:hypothetical protein
VAVVALQETQMGVLVASAEESRVAPDKLAVGHLLQPVELEG